ncbi:AraC family transcriptional regulator [Paenibacillus athensensis]|uniref:HTH araC/xylS-type domain-containing protein n=1 Tax=Paenibacillus athensensis TaxID=1967502 RepID=A0A4Y8Q690_9BACL|nr:helix-turn-helix domain-containing protein [Paenibacillus athensensis]MCD1259504.1 AraC family transcriptional regulator [Paenibacillus athensensis]
MKPLSQASDKGILQAEAGRRKFALSRFEPAPELAVWIEHYWAVRWDLRGEEPYRQIVLSYPSFNIAFENERTRTFCGIYGVPGQPYVRHLEGEGLVLGVKFRPGGFYPFSRQPAAALTGKTAPLGDVFGAEAEALGERLLALDDEAEMAGLAERFLLARQPEPDSQAEFAGRIVQTVIEDRTLQRVEDLVERYGLNIRTLQRLFHRYVGVSPKWVIRRFRLQEAAERLERGEADSAGLAIELGYFDQAHFIKDFKAQIGRPPEDYIRQGPRVTGQA